MIIFITFQLILSIKLIFFYKKQYATLLIQIMNLFTKIKLIFI